MCERGRRLLKVCLGVCLGLLLLSPVPPLLWPGSPAATLDHAIQAVEGGRYSEAMAQLTILPMTALSTQDRNRARYLFAHAAQRSRRYPEALQAFGELAEHYAELGDYVLWNIARIYQDVNAERLAVEALKTLLKRFPYSRLAPQARLALGRQFIGMRGDLSEGVRILEDYLAHHGREAGAPEAHWLLGQGYESLGFSNTALQTYRTLYIRFPASPEAEQVVPRMAALGVPMPAEIGWFSPQERLERADHLAEAGQCERAVQEVQQLPSGEGSTRLAARSARRLGLCAFRLRRDRDAIGALEAFRHRFSADADAPEALYTLALAYQRAGQTDDAERTFRLLADRQPPTAWNAKALATLGSRVEAREGLERAVVVYREIVNRFPSAEQADEYAWRIGWFHYGQRQYSVAAREFEVAGERFPQSMFASNALYWHAKTLEKSGRTTLALARYEQAARDFPYTYYGLRAQEVLRAKSSHNAGWEAKLATPNSLSLGGERPPHAGREPTLSTAAQFHRMRIDELVQLRFLPDAREEVAQLANNVREDVAEQMLLARLYLRVDLALQAIRTLNTALSTLTPSERLTLTADFWTLLFPQPFWEEVREAAQHTRLDPLFILGVIRQESAFNHRAVSRSDARGLMQLLPSTGREVFQRLGMGTFRHELLFDPRLNVRLGSHYLGRLAEAHGSNLILALAAYNAGPGRVKRWLQEMSTDDWDEFIEGLPFAETRGYVKNVLRNYQMYQRLYAPAPAGQASH